MRQTVPSTVINSYASRAPLQQFRFAESTAFACFPMWPVEKSKLLTVYREDWSKRLCKRLLRSTSFSVRIKAGTAVDDQSADELARVLLATLTIDDQRRAEQLFEHVYCTHLPHQLPHQL